MEMTPLPLAFYLVLGERGGRDPILVRENDGIFWAHYDVRSEWN